MHCRGASRHFAHDKGNDDVRSWRLAGDRFFGVVCRKLGKGARRLGSGQTAAQLYAAGCATCHKSLQSVSNTKWFFGLESFLREHYTSSRESAAILAAYLKAQRKPSAESQRGGIAKHVSQARPSEPTPRVFEEDIPRPPADIPDTKQ